MLKIITIVCVIVGLIAALISAYWIRSKMGKGEEIARIFGMLKVRLGNFRRFQYLPVVISVLLIGIPLGAGVSWINAAVFFVGAVICFGTIMATGSVSVTGVTAASTYALSGNMKSSLTTSFRAGSVMGLIVASMGLATLCALLVLNKADFVFENIASLGLGFAIVAAVIHMNGSIYSSSFELAVDSGMLDTTGHFNGTAADLMSSFVLAAVGAVILAKQSVEYADVFATFNNMTAIKYPIIVLAVGIVSSAIVAPLYRGSMKNGSIKGTTAGCFVAAIITLVCAMVLSSSMMQTYNYGYAVASGLVASLVLGEILKSFSSESKIHISGHKVDRQMNIHAPLIFNLANGMMSTLIFATIITASMMVSYFFARNYGVALSAVGICSISAITGALNWMGTITHTVHGIIDDKHDTENTDTIIAIADKLDSAYSKTSVTARSYSSIGGVTTSLALLMCFIYTCKMESVDMLDPFILAGMAGGASIPFFLNGLTSNSVRITARVIFALGHDDKEGSEGSLRGNYLSLILAIALPAIIGFLFGTNALLGFLYGVLFSGAYILISENNAGEYFENDAHRTLGTLIELIMIFSICYLPLFERVDGFLF